MIRLKGFAVVSLSSLKSCKFFSNFPNNPNRGTIKALSGWPDSGCLFTWCRFILGLKLASYGDNLDGGGVIATKVAGTGRYIGTWSHLVATVTWRIICLVMRTFSIWRYDMTHPAGS